ncbi:MAG: DUF3073 domain-containing protein [Varibaculum sp.]|nr:DUF3073 domain-containing protein [Varibaculum sp.]
MGRGRQKAKQTKVARKLKYYSPDTDYDALARELQAGAREYEHDDTDDDFDPDAWRHEDIPSAED